MPKRISALLRKHFLLYFLLLCSAISYGQTFYSVRGYVLSEDNTPLPNASVRVFDLQTGTQTNELGRYELKLEQGLHRISVSYLGYTTETVDLVVDSNLVYHVFLEPDEELLNEVVVQVKKKDYSYEVIKNVIDHKETWLNQYKNLKNQTYVKATEELHKVKPDKVPDDERNPFLADSLPDMNFFEANILRYRAPPNQLKEERSGVKIYGEIGDLFFTSFTDGQPDLYQNLQVIDKLGENALISPFSPVGFLGYKFKLLETYQGEERLIYRIQVKPKSLGNALYEGEVEVIDGIWAIHKVSLQVPKKLLIEYDSFEFEQEYARINDRRVVIKEDYRWKIKEANQFKVGHTEVLHSNFVFDSTYAKNFFGPEIAVTTQEAYEKDSSYWESIRPKPLNSTERAVVKAKELEYLKLNSKEYLDSVDAVYNKITPIKVIWSGVRRINRSKKTNWYFGSIPELINPLALGGWRVQYRTIYEKRFENRKGIEVIPYLNYGFLNKDLRGNLFMNFLYNPIRRSSITMSVGEGFGLINGSATISDFLRRDNFFVNKGLNLSHRTELFNGFYLNTTLEWNKREDLGDFQFARLGDELFESNDPAIFPTTRILKPSFRVEYTPGQKYIREPNEKIVLGSRFPTFRLSTSFGINADNGLQKAFNYTEFNVSQYFNVGIFGTSEYKIAIGKFMDTTRLAPMDYKYQRGGDPIWFSPSMQTYQLIPETFATFDWFLESHYEHQFNGFLTSKIPLLNKTGINTLAGAGLLYVPERKYQYSELYAGANRVFKLGQSRFRLGAYYVVSQSNKDGFRSGIKFSFEPYDRSKNTWSF
ncbi:DUF5686 and carboxypeptidase regulatory-like domain-containing protein [Jiulongibacter sp. NS-SX5]|uniref:DUF5686 and carboxypeptidase regulatory-like domain-containing protein n=1 Tax=Jiulongibacter sp. NS-SX5 TaxID=3463854 RepID=UPI004059232F